MIYQSKKPDETVPVTVDFSPSLPDGQAVGTADVSAIGADGGTAGGLLLEHSVSGSLVTAKAGPYPAGSYFILFLVTTTPGAFRLREDVKLTVKEPLGRAAR